MTTVMLRNLKRSALFAAVFTLIFMFAEKITEKYSGDLLKHSLNKSNERNIIERQNFLSSNLLSKYRRALEDKNFREDLLNDLNVSNYRDFHIFFAVTVCNYKKSDIEAVNSWNSQNYLIEMRERLDAIKSNDLHKSICNLVQRHPELEYDANSVLMPAQWNVKLWSLIFAVAFAVFSAVFHTMSHKENNK